MNLGTRGPRHQLRAPRHIFTHWVIPAGALVMGFMLVFLQTYKTQVENQIDTVDIDLQLGDDRPLPAPPPQDGASGRALNILLMGSDSRDGQGNADLGGVDKNTGGQRSDTTIIAHISADRSRVELVSIPRDTMVQVPNCKLSNGKTAQGWFQMFNGAFALGADQGGTIADAAACTITTVESISGVRIDHFAVVDFAGFKGMVDALGGVPMCIPNGIKSPLAQLELPPGAHNLNGHEALGYARARTGTDWNGRKLSGSDLDRIERQQTLLKNTIRKALGMNLLTNMGELTNFIKAGASSLTMNEQLGDLDFLLGLAFSLRNFDTEAGLTMTTIPVEAYPADRNRVQLQKNAAQKVFQALAQDMPLRDVLAPAEDSTNDAPAATTQQPDNSPGEPVRESPADILASC